MVRHALAVTLESVTTGGGIPGATDGDPDPDFDAEPVGVAVLRDETPDVRTIDGDLVPVPIVKALI